MCAFTGLHLFFVSDLLETMAALFVLLARPLANLPASQSLFTPHNQQERLQTPMQLGSDLYGKRCSGPVLPALH